MPQQQVMPITPGLSIPSWPTPQLADVALIEYHDPRTTGYQVLRLESPHPDTVNYPDHRLVHQSPVDGVDNSVRRIYVNDRSAQNTYNVKTNWNGQDNTSPIFQREYLIRRSFYELTGPATKGLALTGILAVRVTAGGTGYEPTVLDPSVTPTTATISGSGTGATAVALVNVDGAVTDIVVTSEGTGYTGTPTVAIAGTGAGATGTVYIQPASAVLVEEVQDKPEQQLLSRYVLVTRTYMTLPGPIITISDKYDEYGNRITVTSQDVVAGTAPSKSIGLIASYQGVDSVRGKLIKINFPGSFAQITEIDPVDPNVPGSRATVKSYLVDATTTIPADTTTKVYRRVKNPENPALQIEIETTYAIPASFDETEDMGHSFPEIFKTATMEVLFGLYYDFRPTKSGIFPARISHSFGTTRVTPDPTEVTEAEWRFPLGFSGHGLTNGDLCTFTKNGTTITLNLPTSVPTKTTYLAYLAEMPRTTEFLIGGSSRIWHAGIYHTIQIYMLPR